MQKALPEFLSNELPDAPLYYNKLPSSYTVMIDEELETSPIIYKPTILGLKILAQHYREKYGVDIRVFDCLEDVGTKPIITSLPEFLIINREEILKGLEESPNPIGYIVRVDPRSQHMFPIVIAKDSEGKCNIVIFDSIELTLDNKKQIAAVEGFCFFSNVGSRQVENAGCKVDAVVTLKDALRIKDLMEKIKRKICDPKDYYESTSLVRKGTHQNLMAAADAGEPMTAAGAGGPLVRNLGDPEQATPVVESIANFNEFFMPEDLLKTSQGKQFFRLSKPDIGTVLTTTKTGKTLDQKREEHSIIANFGEEFKKINTYLIAEGYKFAKIICNKIGIGIPLPILKSPVHSALKDSDSEIEAIGLDLS